MMRSVGLLWGRNLIEREEAGKEKGRRAPQISAVGSANQTQPIFVEDPLCGRTKLRYAAP